MEELALRPATLDDAALVADVETEVQPDDPVDPVLLRHDWGVIAPDATAERLLASIGDAVVGHAYQRHEAWSRMPERYARIGGELRPAFRATDRLARLLAAVEQRARADGARIVTAWAWDGDRPKLDALDSLGYREERRQRFWELDLVAERGRIEGLAVESRARMRREGVRLLTLDQDDDPDRFRKLQRMSDEADADVPSTVPFVPLPFEQFMRWLGSPGLRWDRIWIAREGDDVVGISMLQYPPVRGVVATDWTGTARKVRGRGIARAVKLETLLQAIGLGVDRVRTDNDSTNAPILHLNETLGYRRRRDMVQVLKALGPG